MALVEAPLGLSRGPREVRRAIADYLRANMPYWLRLARTQWNLVAEELPALKHIYLYDHGVLDVDDGPSIIITISRYVNNGQEQTDYYGADQYSNVYSCRLYLWVKDTGEQETLRLRDDYSTAMQWCLLYHKSFDNPNVLLMVDTMSIEYTLATRVKGDRWIAAATHFFDLSLDETIVLESYGTVETYDVSAVILDIGEPGPAGG